MSNKVKKAFTLVEVLVSLGVIAILMTTFFSVLLISMRVSIQNGARSTLREEISTIASLITKDVRNADEIDTNACSNSSCVLVRNNTTIVWELCAESICRSELNSVGGVISSFRSSDDLVITSISFEQDFVTVPSTYKNTVLVTLVGAHRNDNLNITNLIRQITVSTRNYEI